MSNVIWLVLTKRIGHPLSNEYTYQDFLLTENVREFFEIFSMGQSCSHFLKYHRETSNADSVCSILFERGVKGEPEKYIL